MSSQRSSNKKSTNPQSKYFCILLYQEWDNLTLLLNNIISISNNYAYIQHDKDLDDNNQPKKVHIHMVIEMGARRTIDGLYALLKNSCVEFTSNLIQTCSNLNGAIRYLTHIDYPEKYQYPYEQISTNNGEWLKEHYDIQLSDQQAFNLIINYIKQTDTYISLMDIYDYSVSIKGYKTFQSRNTQISRIVNEHNRIFDYGMQIQTKLDREHIKQMGQIKRDNDMLLKLTNTFDRVQVETETGEVIELMNTGVKRSK